MVDFPRGKRMPDGSHGPSPPYPAAGRIRPVGALAWTAAVAVVITLVARLILLAFGARTFADLDRPNLSGADFAVSTRTLVTLGLVQLGCFLAAAALFLIWLHRARGNAEVLRPGVSRLGRGWALGAWFVPLANLALGPMVVADVWRASAPTPPRRALPVLGWAACVLSAIVMNYAANVVRVALAGTTGRFLPYGLFHGIEALFDIAASALIVFILLRVSRWQTARLDAGSYPPPVAVAQPAIPPVTPPSSLLRPSLPSGPVSPESARMPLPPRRPITVKPIAVKPRVVVGAVLGVGLLAGLAWMTLRPSPPSEMTVSEVALARPAWNVMASGDGSRTFVLTDTDVTVLDPATGEVERTIASGGEWSDLVPTRDGRWLYARSDRGTLDTIDVAEGRVVGSIPVDRPGIGSQRGAAISPDDRFVYLAVSGEPGSVGDGRLLVIEPATGAVVARVTVPSFSTIVGLTPDGGRLYVSTVGQTQVLDTTTRTFTAPIPSSYAAAVRSGDHGYLVGSNELQRLDRAGNPVGVVQGHDRYPEGGAALSPDGARLYVAYGGVGRSNSGELREIDTSTRSVLRRIALPGSPRSVALAPGQDRLYVATRSGRDQLRIEPGPLLVVDLDD